MPPKREALIAKVDDNGGTPVDVVRPRERHRRRVTVILVIIGPIDVALAVVMRARRDGPTQTPIGAPNPIRRVERAPCKRSTVLHDATNCV